MFSEKAPTSAIMNISRGGARVRAGHAAARVLGKQTMVNQSLKM